MTKVFPLPRTHARRSGVFFSRLELNQLLSLYSRRVMSGEWRDYAIDHRAGEAVFSVFRHTAERPIFVISKRLRQDKNRVYVVSRGRETLARTHDIAEALSVLDRGPRLISVAR